MQPTKFHATFSRELKYLSVEVSCNFCFAKNNYISFFSPLLFVYEKKLTACFQLFLCVVLQYKLKTLEVTNHTITPSM